MKNDWLFIIIGAVIFAIVMCLTACGGNGTNDITSPVQTCTVTKVSEGSTISCPDGTNAFIPNGTSAVGPVSLIAACGVASSPWKEVLICLSDGSLLASFSSDMQGDDTRLAIIPDGSYINTDESGCNFTVATSGITRTVSWGAGSNTYSTWTAGSESCVTQ